MSVVIREIKALEILDSRGNPTVRVFCTLSDGIKISASVPSGASTGENEAVELRDGNIKRYAGNGVLKAVKNVNKIIAPKLEGLSPFNQAEIDYLMIKLDGSVNKSKLGANAILGVSMAIARAAATSLKIPLYQYLGGVNSNRLPVPFMNIINGGKHADNCIDFQEYMIAPVGASSFREGLRYCAETFHKLKVILKSRGLATSVGDEGGFAPNLSSNEEACEIIVEAIRAAGYVPKKDIAIAVDPASTSFYENGKYNLKASGGGIKTSAEMTQLYGGLIDKYPIVLLEDGLAENDWDGFKEHTATLKDRVEIVGDDIYVTNTKYIARGIKENTTNAALIKLNQIGTVTETIAAVKMCYTAGWKCFISHRSGETEDTFLADFAVAMGSGQLKAGSVCRGERLAKYNRLLEIEEELGESAIYKNPFE